MRALAAERAAAWGPAAGGGSDSSLSSVGCDRRARVKLGRLGKMESN